MTIFELSQLIERLNQFQNLIIYFENILDDKPGARPCEVALKKFSELKGLYSTITDTFRNIEKRYSDWFGVVE